MGNYEIIKEEPISNAQVYEVILKKEEEKELTYREEKIKEYLKKTIKLNKNGFENAKKELEALEIPRIDEKQIIKILEIMPKDGTQLRAIISHSGTVIVDENVDKIMGVLKKYS